MQTFLTVYLIMAAVGIALRLALLAWADYPRASETTRGIEVAALVVSAAFFAWAAVLKWGHP